MSMTYPQKAGLCAATVRVYQGLATYEHWCPRKAVNTEDGKAWCTQHTPSVRAAADDERNAAYEAKAAIENKRYRLERAAPDLLAALKPFGEMADGKDDWHPETKGCAVFPSLAQVRAARAAVAKAEGTKP